VCTKCGEEKSGNDFNKAKRYEDGLQFWCRACMKANREANKEKSLARVLALQEKNKGMKTKMCPKCKEEKPIDAFNKCRSKKDGLNSHCTACKKAHDATTKDQRAAQKKIYNEKNKKQIAAHKKAYYEANKEFHQRRYKEYRKKNGEKLNKQRRERYAENGEHERKTMKAYHLANRDEQLEKRKEYYQENRERLVADKKKWMADPENRKKIRDAKRHKYNTDPDYRMKRTMSNMVRKVLQNKGVRKSKASQKYFGCTPEFLREHLESQFTPEMNWENAGKVWHIDHIFPVAATNAKDPVEMSVINNWKNLQPMIGKENLIKNDKVFPEARKLFNKLKKEFSKKQAG